MGKGKAQKRRAKNAFRATYSNLHKAQSGRASATTILPQAPKKDDFADHIPKGLRKLQALKEAAEEADKAKRRKLNKPATHGTDLQSNQQRSQADHLHDAADRAGVDGLNQEPGAPEEATETETAKPAKMKHVGLEAPIPFEETQPTKSEKKKLYRKQLRERHKAKRKGKSGELSEASTQMALAASKPVAFGEQAEAPPQISLKRKHWSEQDAAKRNNERCKQIFLKQLQTAEKKASMMTGVMDSGLSLKKKPMQDKEQQAVRAQVIEAYRAKKRQQGTGVGAATRTSLSALVQKGQQAVGQS